MKLSEHFDGDEFKCHCCGKLPVISKDLILGLEKLRADIGNRPIKILSGYRCEQHNRNIGGATKSYHLKGMAADVRVEGIDSVDLAVIAEQVGFAGIGIYNTFIHVDVREKPAKWHTKQPVDSKGEPQ